MFNCHEVASYRAQLSAVVSLLLHTCCGKLTVGTRPTLPGGMGLGTRVAMELRTMAAVCSLGLLQWIWEQEFLECKHLSFHILVYDWSHMHAYARSLMIPTYNRQVFYLLN